MDGKQYILKENEVREGRFSLSRDGHGYKYQVMETRTCDLVVEEVRKGDLLINWNLHYFYEPEDTWNLNRDLLAHLLMCRKDSLPSNLECLFPSKSDPEVTVAIHAGRVPEAYHPVILPSLCMARRKASLIWGTKFTPLILRIAGFISSECNISPNEAIHIVRIEVCSLVPILMEKHQADDFDINRMAGYFKKSLWRACARYVRQDAEFEKRDPVRLGLRVDEDLEFEGSVIEDGIRLDIDPDSLESEVFKYIEHPSTVIMEILLALGHSVELRQIQRIRKKLREALEDAGLRPIPTFAEMVTAGRKKMKPKKLKMDYPEDIPQDAISEVVWLVRDGVKLEENEKN